jgi:hypothetical protein
MFNLKRRRHHRFSVVLNRAKIPAMVSAEMPGYSDCSIAHDDKTIAKCTGACANLEPEVPGYPLMSWFIHIFVMYVGSAVSEIPGDDRLVQETEWG